MAATDTTVMVRVKPAVKAEIESLKVHPRETFGDVVERLLEQRQQGASEGATPRRSSD